MEPVLHRFDRPFSATHSYLARVGVQQKGASLLKHEFTLKSRDGYTSRIPCLYSHCIRENFIEIFLFKQHHIQQRLLTQERLVQGMEVHAFLEYLDKLPNIKSCVFKRKHWEKMQRNINLGIYFSHLQILLWVWVCAQLCSCRKYTIGK